MTKEELKNKIIELKENCKKLAEEYRGKYNQDNENKIALNMFYHNVISYNDYESVLALIENRNSVIMCFSAPPVLTEETVEINLKRIAELEKACDETQELLDKQIEATYKLDKENAELKARVEKQNGDILFLKGLTERLRAKIEATYKLVEENKGLKEAVKHFNPCGEWDDDVHDCEFRHYAMEYGSKLTTAKEIIKGLLSFVDSLGNYSGGIFDKAEQFIKE